MKVIITLIILLCFIAYPLAVSATEKLDIANRPILITPHRMELIREYSRIHYGQEMTSIVPRAIVIHWTASNSLEGTYSYFFPEETNDNEMRDCGKLNVTSHFLVDRGGTIYQLTPDNMLNRHSIGLNWCSIGIENVGGVDGAEDLTEEQVISNAVLVRYLISKYPTITYLLGHYQQNYMKSVGLWHENIPEYYTDKPDPGQAFMARLYKKTEGLPIVGFPLE